MIQVAAKLRGLVDFAERHLGAVIEVAWEPPVSPAGSRRVTRVGFDAVSYVSGNLI
jgi:hypothetical protein